MQEPLETRAKHGLEDRRMQQAMDNPENVITMQLRFSGIQNTSPMADNLLSFNAVLIGIRNPYGLHSLTLT